MDFRAAFKALKENFGFFLTGAAPGASGGTRDFSKNHCYVPGDITYTNLYKYSEQNSFWIFISMWMLIDII
jgi:hypothetical protein